MTELPPALSALAEYRQFILWTTAERAGKLVKLPIDYRTTAVCNAHDPAVWMDAPTAIATAAMYGDAFGVGFVFTEADPFFFLDIDSCLQPDDTSWSPRAMELMSTLSGIGIEVSQSGRGLHLIGKYTVRPEHSCKNRPESLELYTADRFVALTGSNTVGDAALDFTSPLADIVSHYFLPNPGAIDGQGWTESPVDDWSGTDDDDALIEKALSTASASATFGNSATFRDLWECNVEVLAASYPDPSGERSYDASSADAALAQHLAFWTGSNCERMRALMKRSELVRDKWSRDDYLIRTVSYATGLQTVFYNPKPHVQDDIADANGAPKLRASSDAQRNYGINIRAQKLIECNGASDTISRLCSSSGANTGAKFWIDNQNKTPAELIAMITPIEGGADPFGDATNGPEVVSGYQYLGATQQKEHFEGCVYVQDIHRVFTPAGAKLKADQFNATYGGYVFQMNEGGSKTSCKAWDAFVESQVVRYPKAESTCFRPELSSGMLIHEEGRVLVNVYTPVEVVRTPGDVTPFLDHIARLLPIQGDRNIVLAYMAACDQYKGVKFQWCPLIQGTEGNGKTLLTRCLKYAIGRKYTHLPRASEISEKFNEWLFYKLFIGVEDIYVPEHKREVIEILKPMITGDDLEMRAMHQSGQMKDNRANFIINSNHPDAIRKTRNDRRFAIFLTAQQNWDDIRRDGMAGNYFPNLYAWLRDGGYAHVAHYLRKYQIPDQLNPAGACHRAPETSTTHEAIAAGLGGIEQEILEAVDEGRPGFAGGWISSMALEKMFQALHVGRAISHVKRREMLWSLGYDWHPALNKGRVNTNIPLDGGKPKLFILTGHIACELKTGPEVIKAYQEAQANAVAGVGVATFGLGGR